jgi:hypothetical protein
VGAVKVHRLHWWRLDQHNHTISRSLLQKRTSSNIVQVSNNKSVMKMISLVYQKTAPTECPRCTVPVPASINGLSTIHFKSEVPHVPADTNTPDDLCVLNSYHTHFLASKTSAMVHGGFRRYISPLKFYMFTRPLVNVVHAKHQPPLPVATCPSPFGSDFCQSIRQRYAQHCCCYYKRRSFRNESQHYRTTTCCFEMHWAHASFSIHAASPSEAQTPSS